MSYPLLYLQLPVAVLVFLLFIKKKSDDTGGVPGGAVVNTTSSVITQKKEYEDLDKIKKGRLSGLYIYYIWTHIETNLS